MNQGCHPPCTDTEISTPNFLPPYPYKCIFFSMCLLTHVICGHCARYPPTLFANTKQFLLMSSAASAALWCGRVYCLAFSKCS